MTARSALAANQTLSSVRHHHPAPEMFCVPAIYRSERGRGANAQCLPERRLHRPRAGWPIGAVHMTARLPLSNISGQAKYDANDRIGRCHEQSGYWVETEHWQDEKHADEYQQAVRLGTG